ncbi:MAG TPA: hypothetical protein VFH17_03100, partial [Coriobacteriia bacterium]|nr:hypothetical protein [Coriobacteriia bacterium]
MARTLRRKPLLSRLFTTYLTLVVVVMFTGIGPSVPVSFAEESGQVNDEGVVTPIVPGETEELPPLETPPSEEEVPPEPEPVPAGDSDSGVEGDQSVALSEEPLATSDEPETDAPVTLSANGGSGPSDGQPSAMTVYTEPASGLGVVPVRWPGNPDCSDVCPSGQCLEFKIDRNPENITYSVGTVGSITITNSTGTGFNWSASGIEVYFVIVKGGPDANVYNYSGLGGATGDTGLVSPINLRDMDKRHGVSHVIFCYKVPEERPAIAIEKHTNGQDADMPTGPVVPAGNTVTWTYYVTNPGNVPLAHVAVTDDQGVIPAYVSGDTDGDGKLDVGETWMYTASGAAVVGQYVNVGTATGMSPKGSRVADTDPSHYFGARPALSLVKTAAPVTYDAIGDVITYTYTLTNSGNVTLSGPFTVTDDKPTTSRVGAVPVPDVLAPSASATFTATYTITQADLDAGSVKNIAQGFGFWGKDKVESNFDDETVTALQQPALSLVKTATPVTYDAIGDVITYTYTLTNSGNVTLSGPFTVTDDKATTSRVGAVPAPDVLAPGASAAFSATYTITQADL